MHSTHASGPCIEPVTSTGALPVAEPKKSHVTPTWVGRRSADSLRVPSSEIDGSASEARPEDSPAPCARGHVARAEGAWMDPIGRLAGSSPCDVSRGERKLAVGWGANGVLRFIAVTSD